MSIGMDGGCEKCGRLITLPVKDIYRNSNNIMVYGDDDRPFVCDRCYEMYYSLSAVRDKKLEKILNKKWWQVF